MSGFHGHGQRVLPVGVVAAPHSGSAETGARVQGQGRGVAGPDFQIVEKYRLFPGLVPIIMR